MIAENLVFNKKIKVLINIQQVREDKKKTNFATVLETLIFFLKYLKRNKKK